MHRLVARRRRDQRAEGRSRTEEEPPRPVSNYGRSKRAGELEAVARAGDVPITIVRPPIVMGEGDTVGLTLFRMIVACEIALVPGWRRSKLSIIHVRDLAVGARCPRLSAALVCRPATAKKTAPRDDGPSIRKDTIMWRASTIPTYDELGRLIGEAMGRRRVMVIAFPRPAVWPIAAFGESWPESAAGHRSQGSTKPARRWPAIGPARRPERKPISGLLRPPRLANGCDKRPNGINGRNGFESTECRSGFLVLQWAAGR